MVPVLVQGTHACTKFSEIKSCVIANTPNTPFDSQTNEQYRIGGGARISEARNLNRGLIEHLYSLYHCIRENYLLVDLIRF